MNDALLSPAMKTFAAREFAGEALLWAERPTAGWMILGSFAIWLFAIPWTAFALFWISVPISALYEHIAGVDIGAPRGAPIPMMVVFALFGTPFVLIGFGMLLSPLWVWLKARRTLYVLTDRRLAVLTEGRNVTIRTIPPALIGHITRKQGPDGSGTLVLSLGYRKGSDGDRVEDSESLGVIADVRRVERLIQDVKARAARA
jgi:hypothetical protein